MQGKRVVHVVFALVAVLVIVACRTTPTPQAATVVVTPPPSAYAGESVEIDVAIVRGDVLDDEVTLSLETPIAGLTATDVTTKDEVATLNVAIDPSVPAGSYDVVVVASDAAEAVESDSVVLVVLGVEPGRLAGEVRSQLIPTPGDAGFSLAGPFRALSMVPGDDVPAAFDDLRVVPGEVLVRLAADAPIGAANAGDDASLVANGVRFVRPGASVHPGRLQTWVTDTSLSVEATIALATALEARPDVVSATPNWLFSAHQAPLLYDLQWHYPSIDLHEAWTIETGESAPVTVAVIDTGYQAHVDLDGVWLPGYDFVDLDDNATDGDPDFSHGTHVTGTIVMRVANAPFVAGVSRGASIVPVRFLDETGSGSLEGLLAGMVWASGTTVPGYTYPDEFGVVPENPNPARVINMSLGGRVGPCPDEMALVTQSLWDQNVVLIASAGNSSQDTAMFTPANCPGVVTVGATGPYDERAYYSNYGPDVDLFAPGGNFDFTYVSESAPEYLPAAVFSTIGAGSASDYAFSQGTSMAAPHVSGLAALLLAADPAATAEGVLARMASTATPLTFDKCDRPSLEECGAGLIDANLALGGAPAMPWAGAPTVTVRLFACAQADCDDVDPDTDDPVSELVGAVTRGYWPFDFGDVAPGTYALTAMVEAPGTVLPEQLGVALVEVASGAAAAVVIEVDGPFAGE